METKPGPTHLLTHWKVLGCIRPLSFIGLAFLLSFSSIVYGVEGAGPVDPLCAIRLKMVGKTQTPHDMEVGKPNSTEALLNLRSINNVSIKELEKKMRPGHSTTDYEGSESGFIGDHEDLRELLARDNETVRNLGLTHQDLAKPLFEVMKAHELSKGSVFEVVINGKTFKVESVLYLGVQRSPFSDNLSTPIDYIIKNEGTGETIKVSGLLPYFISNYGFYEGTEMGQKFIEYMKATAAGRSEAEKLEAEQEIKKYIASSFYRVAPLTLIHFFGIPTAK